MVHALSVINMYLTHLCIFTLINRHLTCLFLVLCCFKWMIRYQCFACVLRLTIHPSPPPASRLSPLFYFTIEKCFTCLFSCFYFNPLVHYYLYNYFGTTFSYFLLCFVFFKKLNKHPIFTHLTHGQMLHKLLTFKHWHIFKNMQWLTKIRYKFLIITQINVMNSRKEKTIIQEKNIAL